MKGAFTSGPFAELAKRNMEMFEAATSAFTPHGVKEEDGDKDGELAQLKAQLAALNAKIDKLS